MKILHVIPSVSPSQGGPSIAIQWIIQALEQHQIQVEVATTTDDGKGKNRTLPAPGFEFLGNSKIYFFRKQSEFYKVSLPFGKWISSHIRDYDLVHIHALFSFVSVMAARAARKNKIPYVIRPLGLLNRYGMSQRKFLKAVSFQFLEKPLIEAASAIHFTSQIEERETSETKAVYNTAIIPLGMPFAGAGNSDDLFFKRFPQLRYKDVILFLSRFDPVKGLDLLIPAFASIALTHPNAMLVIAGNGDPQYQKKIMRRAADLGLSERVFWPGFLEGEEKQSALAAASMFILPSYSESFGIVVVEALAAGVPCVVSEKVALSEEIRQAGVGVVVRLDIESIKNGIETLLADPRRRLMMGRNAAQLAREKFSIGAMGAALRNLYSEIIAGKKC